MKVKKLFFKYRNDTNNYYLLKAVNVEGFKPSQVLSEAELKKLYSTDIEVVLRWNIKS